MFLFLEEDEDCRIFFVLALLMKNIENKEFLGDAETCRKDLFMNNGERVLEAGREREGGGGKRGKSERRGNNRIEDQKE